MSRGTEVFSLKGKTALVTGASGHLGFAMSRLLAEAGAHVLVNSRSVERGEILAKQLLDLGCSAEPAIFDVKDQVAINRFFAGRPSAPLDVLVNNAYGGGGGTLALASAERYIQGYDVTIVAAHNLIKAALSSLRLAVVQRGDASVIHMASMYALVSPDQRVYDSPSGVNPPFYGAAKAALLQMTRYAACEFGSEGIRVNAISPGPFPSDEVQKSNPAFVRRLAQKVPLARIGRPDEVAGPVLFLASSASSFVNGANIVVDGGWTCW